MNLLSQKDSTIVGLLLHQCHWPSLSYLSLSLAHEWQTTTHFLWQQEEQYEATRHWASSLSLLTERHFSFSLLYSLLPRPLLSLFLFSLLLHLRYHLLALLLLRLCHLSHPSLSPSLARQWHQFMIAPAPVCVGCVVVVGVAWCWTCGWCVGDGSWVLGGVLGGRWDESGWPASNLRSLVTAAELQHDCSRVAAELQHSCSTVAAQRLQHNSWLQQNAPSWAMHYGCLRRNIQLLLPT